MDTHHWRSGPPRGGATAAPARRRNVNRMSDRLADVAQTLGTILTLASCTALSRAASRSGSWYAIARMV